MQIFCQMLKMQLFPHSLWIISSFLTLSFEDPKLLIFRKFNVFFDRSYCLIKLKRSLLIQRSPRIFSMVHFETFSFCANGLKLRLKLFLAYRYPFVPGPFMKMIKMIIYFVSLSKFIDSTSAYLSLCLPFVFTSEPGCIARSSFDVPRPGNAYPLREFVFKIVSCTLGFFFHFHKYFITN